MSELLSLAAVCRPEAQGGDPVAFRSGAAVGRPQFLAQVRAWRNTLAGRRGLRWGMFFQNTADFAAALFGAWQAGKTVVLPGDAEPVTLERLTPVVDGLIGEFPDSAAVRAPSGAPDGVGVSLSDDRLAVVVFTSGSSGTPVAIPKQFWQLDREVQALHAAWGERVGTLPVMASVSHQHFYGLPFKLFWSICRGAPFLGEQLTYPEEVTRGARWEPGVWVASPALLRRLPPQLSWGRVGESVRLVLSAGGPLPLEAARQCEALLGRPVVEIYGSSETGTIGWRTQSGPETPWQPLSEVVVGQSATGGLLTVRSPWLPTQEAWESADRGEVASDGTFHLRGRADRIVKIGEKRVSLTALERALMASPWVEEARALVLPDNHVAAVAILRPAGHAILREAGKRALVKRLRAWMRPRAELAALPRRFRFVEEFPCNAMGKVLAGALEALFTVSETPACLPQVLDERRVGEQVVLRLAIPSDLPCFPGHFPGVPILPGVVQVEWAAALAQRLFPPPSDFQCLEQLKFRKVIRPRTEVTLTLSCLPSGNGVEFRYVSDVGEHSYGRIRFGG